MGSINLRLLKAGDFVVVVVVDVYVIFVVVVVSVVAVVVNVVLWSCTLPYHGNSDCRVIVSLASVVIGAVYSGPISGNTAVA